MASDLYAITPIYETHIASGPGHPSVVCVRQRRLVLFQNEAIGCISSSHDNGRHKQKDTAQIRKPGCHCQEYTSKNKYNTEICILVDMSIESGKNRLFLYNLKNDSITDAGLVTHGRCNEDWLKGRRYGNEVGCGCTSLGKYKVGAAYQGKFGLAYKLHGQDTTNSNAFKRFVVLHSHECVPAAEVDPYPICQSDGCPTVSPSFLKKMAATIDGSSRPILLWIFE
ncbi:murein L,D-transpeptidase catalytic domain-containing protein [Paraflavitalea speifideaquila]|uniref:murein L,D-transpeptidase catalytic domain-containing protein n=1 Tax=Paraflavitalea speifideaquila TaxID=3076558 RepID=UPI0028E4C1C6|nr:murein L,D-transpeptidase catalytic domain family protein [Paraflavitalea speifideiaquila]